METKDYESKVKKHLKKNWQWYILGLILIFGFYLRSYHIDYPVVGYHNWKETHYLTEARNFARDGFFEHGLFIPEWDYPSINGDPTGRHSDTFPTTSIAVAIAFIFFGFKLWIARAISILFALGSIVFFYLIIKKLFKRDDLALISAALMAINPLLVFFGRQVQLINVALFFCLMGTYFYFNWIKDFSWKNTLLFSIPMLLGILTKYSFILFVFPLLFLFPYKKQFLNKKNWLKYTSIILFVFISVAWAFYSSKVSSTIGEQISMVNILNLFSSSFWSVMHSYATENYSIVGIIFAFIGFALFLLLTKKQKSLSSKYIKYYIIGSFVWFIYLSEKLSGHSYHQYPIMPLIVFFIAYAFLAISINLSKFFKFRYLKSIACIILVSLLFITSATSINNMFDTQFIGLNIAGEYIKNNANEGERLLHSGHQSYGIHWHANMKGRALTNISNLKIAEEKINVSWLLIYQWGFSKYMQDTELWNYIISNYSLKQFAFIKSNGEAQPIYFLLHKGGSFNQSELNNALKTKKIREEDYYNTKGKQTLNYVNFN